MQNKNHTRAKILTLIPIVVFVIIAVCLFLASVLEVPTSKGALYSLFALAGVLGMFLSPLPCLVISVLGTVFAAKAVKEGAAQSRKFFIIGIVEILVYVAAVILAIVMFIAGQGV